MTSHNDETQTPPNDLETEDGFTDSDAIQAEDATLLSQKSSDDNSVPESSRDQSATEALDKEKATKDAESPSLEESAPAKEATLAPEETLELPAATQDSDPESSRDQNASEGLEKEKTTKGAENRSVKESAPAKAVALAPEEIAGLPAFVQKLPPAIQAQVSKSLKLKEKGKKLYDNTFVPLHRAQDIRLAMGDKTPEELEAINEERSVAGRIMAKREHGKTVFYSLQDAPGRIQLYLRRDDVGATIWDLSKSLDIGDIIGVKGRLFKTKTGELTLQVKDLRLVTKCMWPLPEKFHTMDKEMRQRRRYLDLIMSPESRRVFRIRSQVVEYIRRFMTARGFLEVETPMLHPIPGGANAQPFKTFHNALKQEFFLRIAPELYLKRLLVGGLDKVFEINRSFRNEGLSLKHNPEFTMLEFYQNYSTYEDLMTLTEELLHGMIKEIWAGHSVTYQDEKLSFKPPFKRVTFKDALVKYGGAPKEVQTSLEAALDFLKTLSPESSSEDSPEGAPDLKAKDSMTLPEIQELIFDMAVEKNLRTPTFVTSYPIELSPLARRNDKDPTVTDRFELYVCGRELANAFSELNDPLDQHERFLAQALLKEEGEASEGKYLDIDYIRALMYGMPPAAGEGIGVDRLVMLLADAPSIRDVILFPQMRPEPEFM
ncbi:MAG: lysine--tRNA ligase [Deltaproteobacteria bacterium]|nr:lysine--tRNA ligase [Deltaproteobacteria bacterium]